MKRVSFLILLVVAMITIVGCSSDKESNNPKKTVDAEKNDEKNKDDEQAESNDGYKELGESGYATNVFGEIEFTPTKVEVFKERDGEKTMNDDEVFVLIDFTLENVGDKTYEEGFISSDGATTLENSQGNRAWEDAYYEYEFVDSLRKDVEPGETVTGQLIFMPPESDTSEYVLTLESTFDDTKDTKWLFTASEE